MPWTTSIAASGDRRGRTTGLAAAAHEDLVGREPAAGRGGDRDERPSGPTQPVVVRRRRAAPAAGRTNWPRATRRDLVRGEGHDREGIEPGVDGQQEREEALGAIRGRRADRVERRRPSSSVNGPDAVRISAPR